MAFTVEQARALQAIAREGSISRAAQALRKRHSALVYSVRVLERSTGLKLVDNSQYRARLTADGERFLQACQRLIDAEQELSRFCDHVKTGWEPNLTVAHEAAFPCGDLVGALNALIRAGAPTRVRLISEYHQGLDIHLREPLADLVVSLLPPSSGSLVRIPLTPLSLALVCAPDHPLAKPKARRGLAELGRYRFLTLRGSNPRLNLPTAPLAPGAALEVGDFSLKRECLRSGLGFGWMPEHLVRQDLARGDLAFVRWSRENRHVLFPAVYHREAAPLGRAASLFLDELLRHQRVPDCTRCTESERAEHGCTAH